jgi:hypothetical protein
MVPRRLQSILHQSLATNAAVALLGPRQVGWTTLAYTLPDGLSALPLADFMRRILALHSA